MQDHFHQELVPLIGTRLSCCQDCSFLGLSPRLRQTLVGLNPADF